VLHCDSKSALTVTDRANQANHIIDWKKTTVIDREQDRHTRWIKEAIHIRKEGHWAMNGDQGSYQLNHSYESRKNRVPASTDEDLMMRSKCQNEVLKFWLWYMNFLLCKMLCCWCVFRACYQLTESCHPQSQQHMTWHNQSLLLNHLAVLWFGRTSPPTR